MSLNLHLLRLFAAVAKHRSFSRAAAALNVSQPAISKGIRELEAQLGAPLLERGRRELPLTAAGEALSKHAIALFAVERAAEDELAALRGLQRGPLAIGASTTIATYLLPPFLGAFHRAHPAIELRLTSANTRRIAELFQLRELDIALVEGPVEGLALLARPWLEDQMALIAAPTHPFAAAGRPVEARALAHEIFSLREPGSGTREVVLAALAAQGVMPRRTLEIGSTEAIKQAVAAGLGVAIVSAAAAVDQISLGTLVTIPMRGFTVRRMLNRLALRGRQPSAAAAAFDRLLDDGASRPAIVTPR